MQQYCCVVNRSVERVIMAEGEGFALMEGAVERNRPDVDY